MSLKRPAAGRETRKREPLIVNRETLFPSKQNPCVVDRTASEGNKGKAFRKGEEMERMHNLIAAVGGIFFLWFSLPFVVNGIINIGNGTGMLVFMAVLSYGISYEKIKLIK